MFTPKDFAAFYTRNTGMMQKFAADLSHEESLLTPNGIEGNCLNWIIGHLVNTRNSVLRFCGAPERQWVQYKTMEELRALYGNGSAPIGPGSTSALQLSQLLEGLAANQAALEDVLTHLPAEKANAEIEALGRKMPLDHLLLYLFGHEQYHIGQLEYVRPLSGKKNP
ncbi:MAG: DinB family protein [Anaerolineae bacterium]|nr:DinB family protein [Anaerolineae bacterium]